jgi:hypothetical protein
MPWMAKSGAACWQAGNPRTGGRKFAGNCFARYVCCRVDWLLTEIYFYVTLLDSNMVFFCNAGALNLFE